MADTFAYAFFETGGILQMIPESPRFMGYQNDHEVQRLVFVRPPERVNDNLVLYFEGGGEEYKEELHGTDGYLIPRDLTQWDILRMQAAFISNGVETEHTNIVELKFGDSLSEGGPVPRPGGEEFFADVETDKQGNTVNLRFFNYRSDLVGESQFTVGGGGGGGEDGATFTPLPEEQSDGVLLSWNNDKGLPNPDPVLIKNGAQGEPGPNQISPSTSVELIPNGKYLAVADGKVVGADAGGGAIDDIEIFLPDNLYAVVDRPIELYNEQVFRSPVRAKYAVYIMGNGVGRTYARRWSYTPSAQDAPSKQVTVYVYDGAGNLAMSKTATVHIASISSANPKTIMMIGDSISTLAISPTLYARINEEIASMVGSNKLTFVGTKGTAPYLYEAFGGARIQDFVTNVPNNAFWNSGIGDIDFAAYTATHAIMPDIAHILLGANNISMSTDFDISRVQADVALLQHFIGTMRAQWENTKIVLGLPTFYSRQDGLQKNPTTPRWKEMDVDRLNQMYSRTIEAMVHTAFDDDENIFICPYNVLMDREFGYDMISAQANPFSTESVKIPGEFIHPQTTGQKQMAAMIANTWVHLVRGEESGTQITNVVANAEFATPWNDPWLLANSGYGNITNADGVLTFEITNTYSTTGIQLYQRSMPFVLGHKIYCRASMKTTAYNVAGYQRCAIFIAGLDAFRYTVKAPGWMTTAGIIELTQAQVTSPWFGGLFTFTPATDVVGNTFEFKEVMCIDLTACFGEGLEPTKEWCDENIPFFTGSIII